MNFRHGIGCTQQAGDEIWIKDCFNPKGLIEDLRVYFDSVYYEATGHRMIIWNQKEFQVHRFTEVNDICEELESRKDCEASGICPDCKNIEEACYCD